MQGHSYLPQAMNAWQSGGWIASNALDECWMKMFSFICSIYIMGLVFEWVKENGGLDQMEEWSIEKSNLIFDTIDGSNGFFW